MRLSVLENKLVVLADLETSLARDSQEEAARLQEMKEAFSDFEKRFHKSVEEQPTEDWEKCTEMLRTLSVQWGEI
jgi:hypothetical protein